MTTTAYLCPVCHREAKANLDRDLRTYLLSIPDEEWRR